MFSFDNVFTAFAYMNPSGVFLHRDTLEVEGRRVVGIGEYTFNALRR